VEMARTMLLDSKLPKSLWAEAVNTAAFLRNRCPTKGLDGVTPEELWSGRKPNVKFLRIFGSSVVALNKGANVSKLDKKGIETVLVGYSAESKAYRLWKKGTKTVFKSRDVRINEENFIEEKDAVDIPILGNKNTDRENSESEGETKEDRVLEEAITNNEDVKTDSEDETTNLLPEPLVTRGRGRPKIIRTGKPGRPRKQFHEAEIVISLSTENPALEEAMNSEEKEKWLEAMNSKIKSLNDCNTWILVDKTHMHVISCKWVFNIKRRQNGEIDRYKARLVARRFEQRSGVD